MNTKLDNLTALSTRIEAWRAGLGAVVVALDPGNEAPECPTCGANLNLLDSVYVDVETRLGYAIEMFYKRATLYHCENCKVNYIALDSDCEFFED